MAKDVRALREEAAEATAAGKYKRALAAYLELERVEPRDAQWAKRAGETYRRLNNNKNAIEAFERSAERYAQNGFLVQAIAVCKLVLQIDPQHASALRRLAQMNEQVGAGPTRAAGMAENNPALHENPNVNALRKPSSTMAPGITAPETPRPRTRNSSVQQAIRPRTPSQIGAAVGPSQMPALSRTKTSTPAVIAVARTKSKPVSLPPGAAIDSVSLRTEFADSHRRDATNPGIHVIPLDDDPFFANLDAMPAIETDGDVNGDADGALDLGLDTDHTSAPVIEVQAPDHSEYEAEVDEPTELELDDIEEIPLPAPRVMGIGAQRALAATPLFAGLPSDALEALVENLALVTLEAKEELFREGDQGDALYVIVEGEVSVLAEGPPRVEMARLGPGSFIGEVALMTDQPRSATVIAAQPSELLRIDRHTLSRVLGRHGDVLRAVLRFVRDRLVDRWMRTSPLFRPFNEQQRAELAAKFTFLEIEDGTKLIGAGGRPDGLYIVLAGQFVVQRSGAILATLGAGELIGETALLAGTAFKSDVSARGKSLALCLPASEFREIIMTHPHVLEYIGEHAEHSRRLQIL
ncbi:MAG: cyclic nucleotide-binding domain-containing protein [Deltaproteobacteria bacterium]|nr:cyclic nucleotide-binding domain-containing protein [Deltaproteobacteria bacterium]MDQ3298906.1 cyclic nucleotide-binding domain-containing protein [Myxococcota bacterium]